MKISKQKQVIGVLALLCSSAGYAATVTVTPSNANPNVGDTFTVTVSGDFTGVNVGAATLGLTFSSAVSIPTPTSSSLVILPGPWTGGGITGPSPFLSGNRIDLSAPTSGAAPTGIFDAFRVTFTAGPCGQATCAADIVLVDNQCTNLLCWANADTFEAIPVTYTQATVTVHGAVIPLPATVWLFATAFGIAGLKRRRR